MKNIKIKIETINNIIVVSTWNYRRNMYIDIADYDMNNKTGNIDTETVNKEIKNFKTWKNKVEDTVNEKINWQ